MANAYLIILILFVIAGLATTVWGWRVMQRARASRRWPSVPGRISSVSETSELDDLLPQIGFDYELDGQPQRRVLEFPAGTSPSRELAQQYLQKYPPGKTVTVYYDPQDHTRVTLEPGATGDWLIFAIGVIATLLGVMMLAM